MYIIVGLGNPGREYENTRHNAGFMVLDEIAGKYGANFVNESKLLAIFLLLFLEYFSCVLSRCLNAIKLNFPEND